MTLKEFIEQNYKYIDGLSPTDISTLFLDVYKDLCLTLKRDFAFAQQIVELKVEEPVPQPVEQPQPVQEAEVVKETNPTTPDVAPELPTA